ncbi:hypothetical protein GXB85_12860 [Cellulomonas sp. APG4]|uniref:hypothetical protein n=1 Tax=Cellulomonas sp. APG4 TaxID=1538656 RepID=UPI00137A8804|nr:hypothetical protein [Cellulomonas sp. APG4]NCT91836.1 hypothetical protein [Cellulomonas sp. APG4]
MSGFEADVDELDAAGRALLGVSDDLDATARRELLEGRSTYANPELTEAAGRFSARLGHLTRVLSDQADAAGVALRGSATHYRESDLLAPAQMRRLDERLDMGMVVG